MVCMDAERCVDGLVQDEKKGNEMSKLIFLDIDGTLVVAGNNIPPNSALDAMKMARKNGHRIFLCTGRNLGMLRPLLAYDFDGIVGSSGGYVTCLDEVLVDSPMSKEELDFAISVLHKNDVFCTIEGRDGSFSDTNLASLLGDSKGGNSEIIRWRKALAENLGIKTMDEYDNQPIYKIVAMANDIEKLNKSKAELSGKFNFMIHDGGYSGLCNAELLGKSFDKGTGIIRIAEHLGVKMEDTIGFGDSMNDMEMAQVVGTSVCMENGSDSLKAISDVICPAVEDDGLCKGFAMLGLI